jgi:hypothetical protein
VASKRARRPLETIFMQLNFKTLVFGTFGKINSDVGELVETAVEYVRGGVPLKEYGGYKNGPGEGGVAKALQD